MARVGPQRHRKKNGQNVSVNYHAACRSFNYRLQADHCFVINVAAILCDMFMYSILTLFLLTWRLW